MLIGRKGMDASNIQNIDLTYFLANSDQLLRNDKSWTEDKVKSIIFHEQKIIKEFAKELFANLPETSEKTINSFNILIDKSLSNITIALDLKNALFPIRNELVQLAKQVDLKILETIFNKHHNKTNSSVVENSLRVAAIYIQCSKYFSKGAPEGVTDEEHLLCLGTELSSLQDPIKATQVFDKMLSSYDFTRHVGRHIVEAFLNRDQFAEALDFVSSTKDKWNSQMELSDIIKRLLTTKKLVEMLKVLKSYPDWIKQLAHNEISLVMNISRTLHPLEKLKQEYLISELLNGEEREKGLRHLMWQSLKYKFLKDNEVLDNFVEIAIDMEKNFTTKDIIQWRNQVLVEALEKLLRNGNLEGALKLERFFSAEFFKKELQLFGNQEVKIL